MHYKCSKMRLKRVLLLCPSGNKLHTKPHMQAVIQCIPRLYATTMNFQEEMYKSSYPSADADAATDTVCVQIPETAQSIIPAGQV
jgi:hypothetical protein